MEWLNTIIVFVLGVGLRLGIPIAVTAIAIIVLRRLDAHWQSEIDQQEQLPVVKPDCWKIKGCAPEQRKSCPVPIQSLPCWQVFRNENGYLRETCLGCDVFLQAPDPLPTRT